MSRKQPPAALSLDGLEDFLPAIADWFRSQLGPPTLPQRLAWPEIAAGRNVLILAPTGSGKTLAAFLACLDQLWRISDQDRLLTPGVKVLYISPLKALNYDISRNLDQPLAGVLQSAQNLGTPLRTLRTAVRTGDTAQADRQRMLRQPPDVLITTPESLHLLLTSKARTILQSVTHVIIDEIHALCGDKRGVFLALLLERLEANNQHPFIRIGLSATQRPLEEVARYLGGQMKQNEEFSPRPVTIIDAGKRKVLDLEVTIPVERFGAQQEKSIWPALERRLSDWIHAERSTIVFANNRRIAERLASHLNQILSPDEETLLVRAHHGSLSQDERRSTEEALKAGQLKAVVSTASLELGIDMGTVDLVCQVESPGAVARGLQRVGRAGHLVGSESSRGKLIAKTASDLLEAAALAHAMIEGEVEHSRVPRNCLDVLTQQVIACVAVESWKAADLFDLVRQAYPYRDLTLEAFESVLNLASGRFAVETVRDLQPRISWDRVNHKLNPLPGTARLAIAGGGTIPDTGQYPVYLGEGGPRLGELDEEFVLERRVGETFILGTSAWRIESIDPLKVIVSKAEGESVLAPFWRGESCSRSFDLGQAVGALTRRIAEQLTGDESRFHPESWNWLRSDYRLEPRAADALKHHVARQLALGCAVPDDRTVVLEMFRDPAGQLGLAILTPLGGKLHQALKLAVLGALKQRLGLTLAALHSDDGVLIRLPDMSPDSMPWDLFDTLTSENAHRIIRSELGESALFGLRYRQNAGRALLLPRPDPSKRTPLWLQRLRARDLLQVTRQFPDFPVVIESYRQCMDEDLDLPRFLEFLDKIQNGQIQVVRSQSPSEIASPFVSSLLFRFQAKYLYEWDDPQANSNNSRGSRPDLAVGGNDGLHEISEALLDQVAVHKLNDRLQGIHLPPRTKDEMAERLRVRGDMAPSELSGPMQSFLEELEREGRAVQIELGDQPRWISSEEIPLYQAAFGESLESAARLTIARRFLRQRALVGLKDLLERYPLARGEAVDLLEQMALEGSATRLEKSDSQETDQYADPRNLSDARRLTIAMRRSEAVAVTPEIYTDFVLKRQRVHPTTRLEGESGLETVLDLLQGVSASAEAWETELLLRRVRDYRPALLDELFLRGDWIWRIETDAELGKASPRTSILTRKNGFAWPTATNPRSLGTNEQKILDILKQSGARFVDDLSSASKLTPSNVRRALSNLVKLGLVVNDRFEPLRDAWQSLISQSLESASSSSWGRSRSSLRRSSAHGLSAFFLEGRWEALEKSEVEDRTEVLRIWANWISQRYGVICRETAMMTTGCPAWSEMAPFLDRSEWKGELRRGYFVEGLSGRQYAEAETLRELALGTVVDTRPTLISASDPANLYGSGSVFDVPLLEGGTARLHKSFTNHLVLISGRPALIVESLGKRLTFLGSASQRDQREALALVPLLANSTRRILKVETCNGIPVLESPQAPWLAEIGFRRDYPYMAFYSRV